MKGIRSFAIGIFFTLLSASAIAQTNQLFPGATWVQDVHWAGTIYAGVAAPVMADVQAHLGGKEVMFHLQSDVEKARPLIDEIHAQGKKYWVNLDASRIEGDVNAILNENPEITDPDFGAVITLEGNISNYRSINRKAWRDFLISCIKRAIDAGADGSQHDGAWPPFNSFDDEDVSAFKQYVIDNGIATGDWNPDAMTFREYLLSKGKNDNNVFNTDGDSPNVRRLIEHWLDFKAVHTLQSWQLVKQTCSDYAAAQGKSYTIALNAGSKFGTRDGMVYFASDYYIGEFFGWGNFFPMTGTVTARSKIAQAFGKRFVNWSPPTLQDLPGDAVVGYGIDIDSEARLALDAQLFASGGLPQLTYPADRLYPVFYLAQANSDLLNSVLPYGEIGVVMSQAETIRERRALEGLIAVLQDLNRSLHVLWWQSNLLGLTDEVTLDDLQPYKVIFLPEVFHLTDNQRNVLLTYMQNGGTVVGVRGNVEYCGQYDENGNDQTNPTWEALVNHENSGVFNHGSGRFINIAHHILEPSGYPPSLYGLAYTVYKEDPDDGYLATSIRDTLEKWFDVALPNKEVYAAELPPYVRFFRYQNTQNHQYLYHVLSDSVELATRRAIPVGPFEVELAVSPESYTQQFEATWYSLSQPNGTVVAQHLAVDPATGRVRVQIPRFERWGFVLLNGTAGSPQSVQLGNLSVNGEQRFRRLKSGSAVHLTWDVLAGNPDTYQLEVWTNLQGLGKPVFSDSSFHASLAKADQPGLLKKARRVLAVTVSSLTTEYLIPAEALRDSLVYLVRLRGIDGADTSAWIKQFVYRNARPGRPHNSQIYTAIQNVWYSTDNGMSPTDTSRHVIFAFNKASNYGNDYELDSLLFGVFVYTDSMSGKAGDTTNAVHLIGNQFKHKLAWNQSMPNARGDIQDTLDFSLAPYENFGIYFRAVATDGIDTSAFSPWFGFYLDNHNDPPNPFSLLEPADSSTTDKQIPFSWENNGDPDPMNNPNFIISRIQILFDSVATFDSPGLRTYTMDRNGNQFDQTVVTVDLPKDFFKFEGLLDYGKVYWKVRMWDFDWHSSDGSNRQFRESSDVFVLFLNGQSQPPPPPVLVRPLNDAHNLPLDVEVEWQPVPGAQAYTFQVALDPGFQNRLVDNPNVTATRQMVGPLAPGHTYYWRVNTRNAAGVSPWSQTWRFSTLSLPSGVLLQSPADGSFISGDTVRFVWQPSGPEVDRYSLEYATNPDFVNAFIDSSLQTTSFIAHGLQPNQTYWWRVRAKNVAGWGPYSVVRQFSVVATSVFEHKDLTREFALSQNYPNPFNPSTKILFSLPRQEYVEIRLYHADGRLLETVYSEETPAGIHQITLDLSGRPSGVYFYRIVAGRHQETKKLILLR